jgi:hypothetical protein
LLASPCVWIFRLPTGPESHLGSRLKYFHSYYPRCGTTAKIRRALASAGFDCCPSTQHLFNS